MTRATNAVGSYGERVAARTVVAAGMLILDRNWRCAEGELDIIALDGTTIVFCEVKTRRGNGFGTPAEAVNHLKVRRLRTLAACWLAAHPGIRGEIRFDVLSVLVPLRGAAQVEHIKAAF
jgi:putative endonuclease